MARFFWVQPRPDPCLSPHVHTVAADGLFVGDPAAGQPLAFVALPPPTDADVAFLATRLVKRLAALDERRRAALVEDLPPDDDEQAHLHAALEQAAWVPRDAFAQALPAEAFRKPLCAKVDRLDLHAERVVGHGHRPEVLWRPLDLSTVVRVLHSPRYAGAFVYGRRRSARRPEGGTRTTCLPREDWHTLRRDAHPGYISWDEFERNQQTLRRSALAYGLEHRQSAPREGPALLQGLVCCGACGGRMTVHYHQRAEGLVPEYCCLTGRQQYRRPRCQIIPGAAVDRAVAARLVATMTPLALELSLGVRAELQARLEETDRLRLLQVQRAQEEATLAARRFLLVDPDHRLVATTLEAAWNDSLQALAQARDEAERQRAADRATFDEATESRIRALAEDFPAVFNDSSTAHRDRKRMAQLLLEDVTLLKTDQLHVHLRFQGGACESLVLPLPQGACRQRLTPPQVVTRLDELLADHDEAEAAAQLNAEGCRTGAGLPFDTDAVQWVRYSHGLKTQTERRRDTGLLTVREAAGRLGLREGTTRDWARTGKLRAARSGRKAVWLIAPLPKQPVAIRELAERRALPTTTGARPTATMLPDLPARVDELLQAGDDDAHIADRLNAEGCTQAARPLCARTVRNLRRKFGFRSPRDQLRQAGQLTTAELASQLGIGINTVRDWARAGRLRGQCQKSSGQLTWLFDPIADQPEPIRQRVASRATLTPRRGVLSDTAAGLGAV